MMTQIQNNPRVQEMLGEFDTALDNAVLVNRTGIVGDFLFKLGHLT
jgi:hypothetical protein